MKYTDARIAFLKKHARISTYDSENLMYATIAEMLDSRPNLSLKVICHQPLNMLIRDPRHLNKEERNRITQMLDEYEQSRLKIEKTITYKAGRPKEQLHILQGQSLLTRKEAFCQQSTSYQSFHLME